MNFLQMRYFVEIATHESFSKAAESLGVSQSALSLANKKLEKELGYPLIENHRQKVTLTPYGKIFLDFCITVTNEMDDVQFEFQEINGIFNEKNVFLGISDTQYYADWLTDIYDIYPDMRLHTAVMSPEDIQHNLINGNLDFGIISGPGIKPALNRRLLSSQPYELLVMADHPMANRTMIDADHLVEEPLVSLATSSLNKRIVDILSEELNIEPNIIFEGTESTMIDLLHAGLGGIVTCTHDKRQYMRLSPENYCSLEILGTTSRYEFYLQWAEHRYFTKYNQLFRNYVLQYYHVL